MLMVIEDVGVATEKMMEWVNAYHMSAEQRKATTSKL